MMSRRENTSAHCGLGEWLVQRLSAVYLGGFAAWLGARLVLWPPADYPAWRLWMSGDGVRLAFAVFFLSVLLHAWVGMRSVFLDYLKPLWLRFAVQVLVGLALIGLAFWAMQILLQLAVR